MDDYKLCLFDICSTLSEYAIDAKKERDKHKKDKNSDYYNGRLHAYWAVMDTIKTRLHVHNIAPKNVGLNINPDKDLR